MPDVTMPRLSDTMQEGTIARWLKQPGDSIERGDVIAQVETDKATMDLEAFDSGTLQEIVVPEGGTAPIGAIVARLGAPASKPSPAPSAPREPGAPTSPLPARPPAADRTGAERPPISETGAAARPAPGVTPSPAPLPATPGAPPSNGQTDGKVRASPLARRIAAEHGIDLHSIQGSGPEGRVIRADVEAAVSAPRAPAPVPSMAPPAPAAGESERIPLSQMRKIIARRMVESTSTIPHFFLTETADVTDLVRSRRELNAELQAAGEGEKLSINDFIVRAAALGLRRVPEVNVSFDGDALLKHHRVHVGVAVALENGLIVPVIRDTDQKSIARISAETRDLATRARAGKLQPDEYSGGTFSISNLGMYGTEQFSAVINPPEAAILAVGAVTREPAEFEGAIALRDRVKLTLSVDHRAVDGATGARFLHELRLLLERPLLLLVV